MRCLTSAGCVLTSMPSMRTLPRDRLSRPVSMRKNVVLPAPAGQTGPNSSPRETIALMSHTAFAQEYSFATWTASIAAVEFIVKRGLSHLPHALSHQRLALMLVMVEEQDRVGGHPRLERLATIFEIDLDAMHQLDALVLRLNVLGCELRLLRDERHRAREGLGGE